MTSQKEEKRRAENLKKYPLGLKYGIQDRDVTRDQYIKFCEAMDNKFDWIKPTIEYIFKEEDVIE